MTFWGMDMTGVSTKQWKLFALTISKSAGHGGVNHGDFASMILYYPGSGSQCLNHPAVGSTLMVTEQKT